MYLIWEALAAFHELAYANKIESISSPIQFSDYYYQVLRYSTLPYTLPSERSQLL